MITTTTSIIAVGAATALSLWVSYALFKLCLTMKKADKSLNAYIAAWADYQLARNSFNRDLLDEAHEELKKVKLP